jgi:hypothetical protein
MKDRPWLKRPVHTAISWYQSSLLPQFVLLAVVTAVLFMVASQIITRSYFNTSLRQAVDAVESDTTLIQAAASNASCATTSTTCTRSSSTGTFSTKPRRWARRAFG